MFEENSVRVNRLENSGKSLTFCLIVHGKNKYGGDCLPTCDDDDDDEEEEEEQKRVNVKITVCRHFLCLLVCGENMRMHIYTQM